MLCKVRGKPIWARLLRIWSIFDKGFNMHSDLSVITSIWGDAAGSFRISVSFRIQTKFNFIFGFPYPKPHSTHFLVPTGIFGRMYRTEQYFGPGRGAVPAGNRFGSVNPPKNTRGYQKMCGVGFRVRGIRI